jgi:hypothetical protein
MRPPFLILLALTTTFVVDGVLAPFVLPHEERGIAIAHGLLIGVGCYLWCKAEAQERGTMTPGRSALWAGVFPILGVPIYFFRTRPLGQATLATAKAFGLFFVFFLLDSGVAEAVRALRT